MRLHCVAAATWVVHTSNFGVKLNFQQLRSARAAMRCGFNLTEAAQELHTSQSGISRQIRELEVQIGLQLFKRSGKRLTGLTDPGQRLLPIVARILAA
jgi:LysR family cys regulon transcriptional activator